MSGARFGIKAGHVVVVLLLAALYTSAGMIGQSWLWGIIMLLAVSGIMCIPLYMHLKKSK